MVKLTVRAVIANLQLEYQLQIGLSIANLQLLDRPVSSGDRSFDFDAFYRAVDLTREARGLNWKQVAEQTAIHPSTLARMGQSKRPDADGLASLSAWSGLNPAEFVDAESADSEPLARISQVLRKDRRLSSGSAKALEEIIRSAYSQLIKR